MSPWNNIRSERLSSTGFQPNPYSLGNKQNVITKRQTKSSQPQNNAIFFRSYESIYNKIFHNRMKFYNRLSAVVAFIVTLMLSVPFNSKLVYYPIKFLLLWFGYFILQKSRKLTTSTVELSNASNHVQVLLSILSSKSCYGLISSFLLNNLIIAVILYSQSNSSLNYYIETPTMTIKPFLNDNFAFFCFFTIISSLVYSFNFLFNQKFILHIPIGTYRQEPIDYLKKVLNLKLLILSILKSGLIFLVIPLIYHLFLRNLFFTVFLKPIVILFNLNHKLPRSDFNFNLLLIIWFYSWISILSIDVLNEFFNAYALVGCLNINNPISSYSENQIKTLLSGLKSENSLIKLTAFQELTYLSTSNDFKNREIFYNSVENWNLILNEFYFILNNAAKSSRLDLPKLKSADQLRNEQLENMKDKLSLFGNLNNNQIRNNLDFDFNFEIENKEKGNDDGDITIIKNDNIEIFNKPESNDRISNFDLNYNLIAKLIYENFQKYYQMLNELINKKFEMFENSKSGYNNNYDDSNNSIRFQFYLIYADLLKFTKKLIFGTIQEQSNKRIPNKEIIGFSIISITELLINAKIEDKNNNVKNSLTEVLILLTKVYKGTYEFLTNPPIEFDANKEEFSIKLINELSLSYFFKIVIYYNNILNDLLLPPEVFKLAKWCTDMALEQQKEQQLKSDIL